MPKQPLIVGNPVLVVVDIQEGGGMSADDAGIPVMPGHAERVVNATTNGKIYMGLSAVSGDAPIHRTPTGASADDVLRNNR